MEIEQAKLIATFLIGFLLVEMKLRNMIGFGSHKDEDEDENIY